MTATGIIERRELDHRASDGIEVTLFWTTPSDRVAIAVCDTRSGETLEFEVEGSNALDAFNHPYAYAAALHAHHCAVSRLDAATLATSPDC